MCMFAVTRTFLIYQTEEKIQQDLKQVGGKNEGLEPVGFDKGGVTVGERVGNVAVQVYELAELAPDPLHVALFSVGIDYCQAQLKAPLMLCRLHILPQLRSQELDKDSGSHGSQGTADCT